MPNPQIYSTSRLFFKVPPSSTSAEHLVDIGVGKPLSRRCGGQDRREERVGQHKTEEKTESRNARRKRRRNWRRWSPGQTRPGRSRRRLISRTIFSISTTIGSMTTTGRLYFSKSIDLNLLLKPFVLGLWQCVVRQSSVTTSRLAWVGQRHWAGGGSCGWVFSVIMRRREQCSGFKVDKK